MREAMEAMGQQQSEQVGQKTYSLFTLHSSTRLFFHCFPSALTKQHSRTNTSEYADGKFDRWLQRAIKFAIISAAT
jgi:hypothetical protein